MLSISTERKPPAWTRQLAAPAMVVVYAAVVISTAAILASTAAEILMFCLAIWATVAFVKFGALAGE